MPTTASPVRAIARAVLSLLAVSAAALISTSPAQAAQSGRCPGSLNAPAAGTTDDATDALVCLINAERTSRGMKALHRDGDLGQAARGHSSDMVKRDYFSHVTPGGADLGDRVRGAGYGRGHGWKAGEALGWGTGTWPPRLRSSTSGSRARRTGTSCSTRATASWAWASPPAPRGRPARGSQVRLTRSTSASFADLRPSGPRRHRGPVSRRTAAPPSESAAGTGGPAAVRRPSSPGRMRTMTASAPSGAHYGVTSMVAPLRRVLVRRPATAGDWAGAGWRTPDSRPSSASTRSSSSCWTTSASRSRRQSPSTARSTPSTCTTR